MHYEAGGLARLVLKLSSSRSSNTAGPLTSLAVSQPYLPVTPVSSMAAITSNLLTGAQYSEVCALVIGVMEHRYTKTYSLYELRIDVV